MYDAHDCSHLPSSSTPTPSRVSLPFTPCASPASRRLSSWYGHPIHTTPAARRPLAWVSLQGRLINAHEATSAALIGGDLAREEALAWELFSPLHRVLLVALVAVAARESKRLRIISQLQQSVDLRDQVLESMQQKLEDLCEQMNSAKDQSMNCTSKISYDGMQELKGAEFMLTELNPKSGIGPFYENPSHGLKEFDAIESGIDDVFKINQQEERRMSDLSDLWSSGTSSVDIQLSSLAAEQEFYNLRKECKEKDATLKELAAAAHATKAADSKRIMELEEIIRRKNMIITRLKKDMVVLEQKVIQLTRERRSSSASNMKTVQLPAMANNVLYDMSSTSSSSSDSDSPTKHRDNHSQGSEASSFSEGQSSKTVENQRQIFGNFIDEPTDRLPKRQSVPNYFFRTADPSVALRSKRLVSSCGEFKRTTRHTQQEPKGTVTQKRWV